MRLGVHVLPQTLGGYIENLGQVAASPKTLVFLDTSVIGYLYKLHSEARREFFAWVDELDIIDGRMFVPAWVANEYLEKFKSGKFSEYAPSRPERVLDSLYGLRETASLFVDEDSLRKARFVGTRDDFLKQFGEAIDRLSTFTSVFNQQFNPWIVHDEVTEHLSRCILHSDLAALSSRAIKEGDARFAHRLPPGHKDGGKSENKFGDLIIWLEIVEHARANAFNADGAGEQIPNHVLFVTNDEKSDWVYPPEKRLHDLKGELRPVKNIDPAIKLPDPRLVAEFRSVVGHDHITITTLPMLIRALSAHRPKDFETLASAIQVEGSDNEANESSASASGGSEEPVANVADTPLTDMGAITAAVSEPIESTETAAEAAKSPSSHADVDTFALAFDYPLDALRDSAFEYDEPGVLNDVIRALRSHNWYVQNPAMQRIKELRGQDFEPRYWFVLGRNVYQSACGNAQKALEFIKNLDIELSRFPEETANHLLAGMAYEIYFDGDGKLRRRFKAAHIEQILREMSRNQFAVCRETILKHLSPFADGLPFKPGSTEPLTIEFEIEDMSVEEDGKHLVKPTIKSIRFLGIERLSTSEDKEDLTWLFGRPTVSIAQIRSEVSENYAAPEWAIRISGQNGHRLDSKLHLLPRTHLSLGRPQVPQHE